MNFRFQPILTIATLAALVVLLGLGGWQIQRLDWKRGLIAKTQARVAAAPIDFALAVRQAEAGVDQEYVPVRINGVFDHDAEAPVNGLYGGAPGAYVFTPLSTAPAAGAVVYINRGFVPQAFIRRASRPQSLIPGDVVIEGLFRSAEVPVGVDGWVRPKDQPADSLWYTRDPRRFAAAAGSVTGPYYIDSFAREGEGPWPKGGVTQLEFPNRHLEYALTWFGLAATLVGVYAAYTVKKA